MASDERNAAFRYGEERYFQKPSLQHSPFSETQNSLFPAESLGSHVLGGPEEKGASEGRFHGVLLPVWGVLREGVPALAGPSRELVVLHAHTRFASHPQRVDAFRLPDARHRAGAQLRSEEPVHSLLVHAAPP